MALFGLLSVLALAGAITLTIRVALQVPAGWGGVAIFAIGAIALAFYAQQRVTSAVCPSCKDTKLRFESDNDHRWAMCRKCSKWGRVYGGSVYPLEPETVNIRHPFMVPFRSFTELPTASCAACGAEATQLLEVKGSNDAFGGGGKLSGAVGGWSAQASIAHCSAHQGGAVFKQHRAAPVLCVSSYRYYLQMLENNPGTNAVDSLRP